MSRFLSRTAAAIKPYVPGEQPRDRQYIKLNTNELPYPPSPKVAEAFAAFGADDLRLYPDPEAVLFRESAARVYGVREDQIFAGGGSDEILAYAFMAFFGEGDTVCFPAVTYGFYQVYADLFRLKSMRIPMGEGLSVRLEDYYSLVGNAFLANPNAPTGLCLAPDEIERILAANPDRLLVLDEAYIDFSAGKSCLKFIDEYDNLLVVQTFSKSRGLAGMRLGLAFGNPELIAALERIKFSFNPYNIDRVSFAAGIAALEDTDYLRQVTAKIITTRENTRERLIRIGFDVLPSETNFLFARGCLPGGELYRRLKERGILVRHFGDPAIADYIRITIGTDDEMQILFERLEAML